jgi:hypothetical protein
LEGILPGAAAENQRLKTVVGMLSFIEGCETRMKWLNKQAALFNMQLIPTPGVAK